MALTPTIYGNAVAKFGKNDQYEVRDKSYGMFAMAKKNAGSLIDAEVAEKRKSLSQSVVIPVLNKGHVTTSGGRVIGSIPASLGTSAFVTLATQTFQREFALQPAENYSNEIKYQQEMVRTMREAQLMLLSDIETYIYTQVNAARSQADNSGAYPIVANAFRVPNTDYQKVLNMLSAIYRANDYNGIDIGLVANPMYESEIMEILEHGTANDQNKKLRIAGKDIKFSNAIVPGADTHVFLSTTEAGYEVLNFNEPDAVLKTKKSDAEYKGTINLPLLGMEFGLYVQKDYIANPAGTASTLTEKYSLATDLTVVTPYLSTPATDPAANMRFELI